VQEGEEEEVRERVVRGYAECGVGVGLRGGAEEGG
jgi:hypothetical protein